MFKMLFKEYELYKLKKKADEIVCLMIKYSFDNNYILLNLIFNSLVENKKILDYILFHEKKYNLFQNFYSSSIKNNSSILCDFIDIIPINSIETYMNNLIVINQKPLDLITTYKKYLEMQLSTKDDKNLETIFKKLIDKSVYFDISNNDTMIKFQEIKKEKNTFTEIIVKSNNKKNKKL